MSATAAQNAYLQYVLAHISIVSNNMFASKVTQKVVICRKKITSLQVESSVQKSTL